MLAVTSSQNTDNQAVTNTSSENKPKKIGRPKGSKHKLQEGLLRKLAKDFDRYGAEAIAKTREKSPAEYLRIIASLMPKNVTLTQDASDTFLDALRLMQAMRKPEAEIPHPDQMQSSKVVNVVDLDPETGQPIENKR